MVARSYLYVMDNGALIVGRLVGASVVLVFVVPAVI